jgi:hypothetical protein
MDCWQRCRFSLALKRWWEREIKSQLILAFSLLLLLCVLSAARIAMSIATQSGEPENAEIVMRTAVSDKTIDRIEVLDLDEDGLTDAVYLSLDYLDYRTYGNTLVFRDGSKVDGIVSAAFEDIDWDSSKEVVLTIKSLGLRVFTSQGQPLWYDSDPDYRGIAIGDINGDGYKEIMITEVFSHGQNRQLLSSTAAKVS